MPIWYLVFVFNEVKCIEKTFLKITCYEWAKYYLFVDIFQDFKFIIIFLMYSLKQVCEKC